MELADILSEGSVLFCSDIKTKEQLLRRLASAAAHATGEAEEPIYDALFQRESLGSTGLGNGIAIPHGKLPSLSGVTAVFAKLDPAIEFEAVDDQPVDLVMMLLAPVGSGADHLKALARVARILRSEAVSEQIRRTVDTRRIYRMLTEPVATTKAA